MWGGEGTDMLLWDWFVGLKSLDKPVELWNFPTATHDVFQASHRLITNQLLIDWFVFWLKGEERSELLQGVNESERSLAQQYARWRFLRKQQEEVLKEPRPPLLKWTATALTDTFKTAEASPQ